MKPDNCPINALDGGKGVPPEPNWTLIYRAASDRAIASDHWRDIVSEMKAQSTLALVNGPAIKRLVMFNVEFERQARAIGKSGVVRKAARTKVPMVHPAWSVMKQAAEAAAALEAELGISPRRRNNAGKHNRQQQRRQRPADAFLKPVS